MGGMSFVSFEREVQRAEVAEAKLKIAVKALGFYSGMNHLLGMDEWDTVSGEGENWIFPQSDIDVSLDRTEGVETGGLARQALAEIEALKDK